MRVRIVQSFVLVLFFAVCSAGKVGACPFCAAEGTTLSDEVDKANIVIFGTLSNAKQNPNEFDKGTTDVKIVTIVKDADGALTDRKLLTVSKYLPFGNDSKTKFLMYIERYEGRFNPYRGIPFSADSEIGEYLKGSRETKGKPVAKRLEYYFKYLNPRYEIGISADAYLEFAYADYQDVRKFCTTLTGEDRTRLLTWLSDPETPPMRIGLYSLLLGHCGKKEDAAVIRRIVDDPNRRFMEGLDGLMACYVMLDPVEGWSYLKNIMAGHHLNASLAAGAPLWAVQNPLTKELRSPFLLRMAAMRSARFFFETRPDLVSKEKVVEGVLPLTGQEDISDLAIDTLRTWQQWQLTDDILNFYKLKSHDVSIIRRSILKFAMSAPASHKRAAKLVEEFRKEDPERYDQIQGYLDQERRALNKPVDK